jgi:predicted transcriptional regulator
MFEILFGSSTRSKVLDIIYHRENVSLKEIYAHLDKGHNLSYQAIHKTLNQLVNDKVLEKNKKQYLISDA